MFRNGTTSNIKTYLFGKAAIIFLIFRISQIRWIINSHPEHKLNISNMLKMHDSLINKQQIFKMHSDPNSNKHLLLYVTLHATTAGNLISNTTTENGRTKSPTGNYYNDEGCCPYLCLGKEDGSIERKSTKLNKSITL